MVAIVSGSSAGLDLTSSTQLGLRGSLGEAGLGSSGERSYVNVANGNLVLQDTDAVMAAQGLGVSIVRTYNSQGTFSDDNGDAWTLNVYRNVTNLTGTVNTAGSTIQRIDGDGSVLTYDYDATRQLYVAESGSGSFDTLSFSSTSGQWTWTDAATQDQETYSVNGAQWRLTSSTDTNGNTVTYAYDGNLIASVTDASGDAIEFSYTGDNLTKESIRQADGTYLSATYYSYDADNRLQQVTTDLSPGDDSIDDGNVYVTTYSYLGDTNLISSLVQTDGTQLVLTYVTVNGEQRIASMTDALGRVTSFSYDTANNTTTVTDPLGNTNIYVYDANNRLIQATGPEANGLTQYISYAYDAAGDLISAVDGEGNQTDYTYDADGNLLSKSDSLGNLTVYTYDSNNRLLTSTVYQTPANGSTPASDPETTRYVYDANGNPRFVINADGEVTEYRYNSYGQRTTSISYPADDYNVSGLSASDDPGLAQMTTWSAAQDQGKTSRIDYQYNLRGQLIKLISYAAVQADGTGVTASASDTSYTYDISGNLLTKIDANGKQTSYTYDGLNRLLATTDALGNTVVNQYDDADHIVSQTQANGRIDTSIYDSDGELISTIVGGTAQSEYRYDALGRLVMSIDPTGVKQFYVYDAAGNLQGQVDGKGDVTQYVYNVLGQRVQTIVHSVPLSAAEMAMLEQGYSTAATAVPATPEADVPQWNANTVYAVGDQVVYGGKVYQVVVANTGIAPDTSEWNAWTEVDPGSAPLAWSVTQVYAAGDEVTLGGQTFVALWSSIGQQPGSNAVWQQVPAVGQTTVPWLSGAAYQTGDQVTYLGQTWTALWDTTGDAPGNSTVWESSAPSGTYATWLPGVEYQDGQTIAYNGQLWQAQWSTQGDTPGDVGSNVWLNVGAAPAAATPFTIFPTTGSQDTPAPLWMSGSTYATGDTVTYAGQQWIARWDSNDVAPGTDGSWIQQPAAGTYAPWMAGVVYTGGETMEYNGHLWLAQWYTQGDVPGSAAVWADEGVAPAANWSLAGAQTFVTNPGDQITRDLYDADGRLSMSIDASGHVTEYQYDGAGNLVATTQFANAVNTSGLTVNSLPQDVTVSASSDDRSTYYYYNSDNQVIGSVDADDDVTQYQYDDAGNLVETTRYANTAANAASISAESDFSTLVPATSTADQHTYDFYDGENRLVGEVDAEGYLTEQVYDANGNVTSSIRYANKVSVTVTPGMSLAALRPASSAQDQSVQQTYDALNRVATTTDASGTVTQYTYDSLGNVVQATTAAGTSDMRQINQRYDQFGQVIATLSGLGSSLLSSAQTQAQVNAIWVEYGTTYAYDAAGRRISSTDPNGNTTLYYYDASGNLTDTINALGEVQEQQYNALGQLTGTVQYSARLSSLSGLTGGLADTALSTALASLVNSALDSNTAITYNLDGTVASTTDALGAVTTYAYDAFGDQVSSTKQIDATHTLTQTAIYDKLGLETSSVTDPGGLNLTKSVQYDAFGRIVSSTDANGNITQQTYDRLGRIVTTTNATGARSATTYDAFGRVLTQTDALGNTTTYQYNSANRSYTVTTPEGVSMTVVDNREGQTQSVTDGNGNVTSYAYDADGNLLSTTTAAGTTHDAYDQNDRLIQTTDADGNITSYTYDAANRILSRTVDPSGLALTTSYQYDAKGEEISATDPNGIVTTYSYDQDGNELTQVVDPTGLDAVTRYTYDDSGNVLSVTSPGGSVTQYTYDSTGRLINKTVDAGGSALSSSYAYDSNGNLTSATDPNGNVTRYVYDADNRLVYTIDAAGDVKHTVYDADGRTTESVSYATPISLTGLSLTPDGADIAARVVTSTGQDAIQYNVYDQDGHISYTVDGTGAVTAYNYDANGNVVGTIYYANRIDLATWTPGTTPPVVGDYLHDECLRVVYNAVNEAIYTVNGDGATTAYTYDANGNVITKISYANPILEVYAHSAYSADGIPSNLSIFADPTRDIETQFTYDADNRVSYSANSLGAVTHYVYDKDGNVVEQIAYATTIAANAAPSSVTASGNDRVNLFAYDAADRLVYSVDSLGSVTKNTYDANGNLVQQTSYATAITAPTSSSAPLSAATLAATVHTNAASDRTSTWIYDGANRNVYAIDSLGDVTHTSYDADGNVIAKTAYATALTSTVRAALSVPATPAAVAAQVQTNAGADRQTDYAYDAAGRLIYTVDAQGYVTKNTYDALGRITATTLYANPIAQGTADTVTAIAAALLPLASADQTNTFSYDADGNLTSSTDALGHSESYTYDANGNKLSFTDKNGNTWTYSYDAAGHMLSQTDPAVAVTAVSTDANGNLVAGTTTTAAVVTQFTYDALGNVLTVTEAAGRPEQRVTTYVYDALGRQVEVIYPAVSVYNASADSLTTNGATGVASRTETTTQPYTQVTYDVFGDAVANRDVNGNYSYKAYDSDGNVLYDVDADGYATGYSYDAFGDAVTLTRYATAPTLSSSGATAPTAAQLTTAIQAVQGSSDRTITTAYDQLGRAIQITEPASWVSNGTQSSQASEVTRNTYNAFGQVVQTAVLADAINGTWATTTNYYDRDGRNVATINALGYLTTQSFDAAGNLTQQTQYANAVASWSVAGYSGVTTNASDRTVAYGYDQDNRQISQTQVGMQYSTTAGVRVTGNVTTTCGYDAVGNQTSMTDATGATTYSYFDAMGRVIAVSSPTVTSTVGGTPLTPLTVYRRDALGNITVQIAYANGAASATSSGYTAGTANASDRTTLSAYNSNDKVIETTNANGVSAFSSYDAAGELMKTWQGVTGNDGITHTLFTAYQYDAVGHLINTITPASTTVADANGNISTVTQATAGLVQSQSAYDAFGEVVKQGTNGSWQVYFNYDNAGNLWRTNSGDGVDKVMLYNLQGVQVSLITSAGSGADASLNLGNGVSLATVTSAEQAEQLAGTARTDSQVDLLGRVTSITLASRSGVRPVAYQTFDRWGNVLSRSTLNGLNSVNTYEYNSQNQLILQKTPDGNGLQSSSSPVTQVYYDMLGRQIAMVDANGNVTTQSWDADGNVQQQVHADGGVGNDFYDAFGDQVESVDALGDTVTNVYDHLGQKTQTSTVPVSVSSVNGSTYALSSVTQALVTTAKYDEAGRLLYTIDPAGNKTSYTYDLRGNKISTTSPMGAVETYAYDNQGNEIASKDANGAIATWNYDYFGLLESSKDIGGSVYTYTYDAARQLVKETSTGGVDILTSYDGAGEVTQIKDVALDEVTLYSYNIAGQHIREQTIVDGKSYQDNWLAYNAAGELARIDSPDDGLSVVMTYDNDGNQLHVETTQTATSANTIAKQVVIDGVSTTVTHDVITTGASTQDLWYAYDSMNQQILVDGAVDSNAGNVNNVNATQGHVLTYDADGNILTDTYWGESIVAQVAANGTVSYVDHTGMLTEYYSYDQNGRLSTISMGAFDAQWNSLPSIQAVVIDQRYYDADGNIVEQGAGALMPAAYRAAVEANSTLASTLTTTVSSYDADGKLLFQRITALDGTLVSMTDYRAAGSYDAQGNLLSYTVTTPSGISTIVSTQTKAVGYERTSLIDTTTNTGQAATVSTTTYSFDVNGLQAGSNTASTGAAATSTSYIRDASGNILQTISGDQVARRLVTSNTVLASWSNTSDQVGNHMARVSNYDESGNAMVQVKAGDTLQSLAQMAYGNSSLWYVIADANGMSNNTQLTVGSYISVPPVGSNGKILYSQSATGSTFGSSDGSSANSATSTDTNFWNVIPSTDSGGGGCGGLGEIVMLVVAAVVTYYTAGAAAGAFGAVGGEVTAASVAAGAVGAVAGSVASQAVGIAIGAQNGFSWSEVAEAAIGGAATAGFTPYTPVGSVPVYTSALTAVGRAAASDLVAQGVEVAAGLQNSFSWKEVLASSVSAGVSTEVGNNLPASMDPIVGNTIAEFAGQASGSLVTTGSVDVAKVAEDSFGNAVGNSIGNQLLQSGQQGQALTFAQDVANRKANSYWNADTTVDNWDGAVMGNGGDNPSSPTTTTTLTQEDVDPWSNEAQGFGENPNAPVSNLTLLTVGTGGADGTVEGLAKQQYGDQWRAGEALIVRDNNLKANQWGSPIIQPGQTLVANDLSVYSDAGVASLSQVGGNIEANNSQGLAARDALMAQQPSTLSVEEQAYATYMAAGGRNSEVAGPAIFHTSSTPIEVPVYDAMGNVTGMQTEIDDSAQTMSYEDQMEHVGEVAIGALKGTVNGVPKMVMGTASLLWQGAQMEGLTEAAIDPQTAYGIASQSTKDWSNGEILPYSNSDQRLGGYPGELLSPGIYAQGVQLGIAGLSIIGPDLLAMSEYSTYRLGLSSGIVDSDMTLANWPRMGSTERSSSMVLGEALEISGDVRPADAAAHHIVAGNAELAEPARAVLQNFGIGINDADNGVFLPSNLSSQNPTGAAVHSTVHTNDYYQTVNEIMIQATSRQEATEALGLIKQTLLNGGF